MAPPVPYLNDTQLTAILNDPSVTAARTAANDMGAITPIGHFTGTAKPTAPQSIFDRIKSIFSGAPASTTIATDEMGQAFGQIALQESMKTKAAAAGLATEAYDREIARLQGVIRGHAEQVFPQMHAAKIEHLKAQQAIGEAQMKAIQAAENMHLTEWNNHLSAGTLDAAKQAELVANRTATLEAITNKFQPVVTAHADVVKSITELEAQVQHHTGLNATEIIAAKSSKAVPAAAAATKTVTASGLAQEVEALVAKNAETGALIKNAAGEFIHKDAAALGVVGHEAYEGLGWFGKMKANIGANLGISGNLTKDAETGLITAEKSGLLNKGIKLASAGAGVFLIGSGLKDLGQVVGFVSPDVDEQGKEIPADSGKLIKSIAECGAGGLALYLSVLKGGKAAGMVKV